MTDTELRDYFAAAALQGMLAASTGWGGSPMERLAKRAYRKADWMMKARKCTPQELTVWDTHMGQGY